MKAVRIAVDIDEVLAPFLPTMKKWRPPEIYVPPKHRYIYREIYNISEPESRKMVREFYDSEEFANMTPIEGSLLALTELKKKNKLYIVTGRQEHVRDKTQTWISDNFPGIFSDVILTNSYTTLEVRKANMCKMLNIGLMIDDNFNICKDCMNLQIAATNFVGDPVYPWCEESTISVRSWKAVNDILIENQETV